MLPTHFFLHGAPNLIIITKSANPREGWKEKIDALLLTEGDPSVEFIDMKAVDSDGPDDLLWDGPPFEE